MPIICSLRIKTLRPHNGKDYYSGFAEYYHRHLEVTGRSDVSFFTDLASIRKHLAPGGVFVLDIFDPDLDILTDSGRAVEFGDEEPFSDGHGRTVTVSYRNPSVDTENQIVHCEMIFSVEHGNGKRERFVQEFIMRYILRYEAEHLLYRSGFAVESLSGGYNGEPVGAGELVFTAVP